MIRRPFTLLELLLVLLILGLIAGSAALMVGGQVDQQVDANNRVRLEAMRNAIAGSLVSPSYPSGYNGFVSDMGRYPANALELLVKPATAAVWKTDILSGVDYGWKGPYLSTPFSSIAPEFRDAWSNASSVNDNLNFGWGMPDAAGLNPFITSLGKDGGVGGSGYDADLAINCNAKVDISALKLSGSITVATSNNARTYYNANLKGKLISIGFLTEVNANLFWSNPIHQSMINDTQSPSATFLNANWTTGNLAAVVYAQLPTVATNPRPMTFAGKNIAWGKRQLVVFAVPPTAAAQGSTKVVDCVIGRTAANALLSCSVGFEFYPGAPLGKNPATSPAGTYTGCNFLLTIP